MTCPAGTVSLLTALFVPTTRLAASNAASAAASSRPTTLGVLIKAGPEDTTRSTAVFFGTGVVADGVWLMTIPAGIVSLSTGVTVPTVSLAASKALSAAA